MLTDEKIADVKEYLARSMKVTASSLIPQLSKYGLDLIDTIEALQQENEQLRAKLEEWKYEVKCHMDEVVARDKEIEKLRAQVARMREALKQAGKAIYDLRYTLNYFKNKSGLKPYDNMTQAQEALAAIDKAIGGKEDE
jgi:predicted RNase H-like nuclease (RuvC/YqgF family)